MKLVKNRLKKKEMKSVKNWLNTSDAVCLKVIQFTTDLHMNWNTVETKTENVFQQPRPPDIYQVNLRLTTFTAIYLIRWREKPLNMCDLRALKLTLIPENRKGCVRADFSSFDSCRNGGRVKCPFPCSAYFPKRRIKRGPNYWICF